MNKQQEQFCISYVATRDTRQSALQAGYSKSYSETRAYNLPKQFSAFISELEKKHYHEQFKKLSINAVQTIEEIINNSDNDTARLSASKYILELSGVVQPQQSDIKIEIRLPDEYRN